MKKSDDKGEIGFNLIFLLSNTPKSVMINIDTIIALTESVLIRFGS
jgi:hypothetical protein